jgi:hypothetical protein
MVASLAEITAGPTDLDDRMRHSSPKRGLHQRKTVKSLKSS